MSRRKLLIVDGYNVLRSGSRYRHILEPDYTDDLFNRARECLINDVAAYVGSDGHAVIVFDGADNVFSDGSPEYIGGVEIIFSAAGQPADDVIEKLAHDACERMEEIVVVTSDSAIQDAVFGGGVERMSAEGFSREMEMYEADVHADEQPEIARKNTVAERIDTDTLSKLKTIRDKR